MAPSLFAFVNTDGGNLTLVSLSDTSEGLLIVTTPSDPFLVQGMQPGETRRIQQNVSVRYLDDPSDQRYSGTVNGELTYVGTYQMTVPAGTYPAILLRQKLSGKVGPANADDTSYYFFAPNVGVVAMIRQEDVEAFWGRARRHEDGESARELVAASLHYRRGSLREPLLCPPARGRFAAVLRWASAA
jgi:hypothetical protein